MDLNSESQNERLIIMDTETTGFEHENGHKIIEIGAIEVVNRRPTGRTLHLYLDPKREVDEEAAGVHGWDWENLIEASGGKTFEDHAKDILSFFKGSTIVAHNAPFDMGHLDAEFRRIGWPELSGQVKVTDTLVMANRLYPGRRNNLDMLASRLGVDTSARDLHGALLDSEILLDVFLLMTTKQQELLASKNNQPTVQLKSGGKSKVNFTPISPEMSSKLKVVKMNNEEIDSHSDMLDKIAQKSGDEGFGF